MRQIIVLGGLAVAALGFLAAVFLVNRGSSEALVPGPAALFQMEPDDAREAQLTLEPASANGWDSSDLHLSDYYPDRDMVPTAVLAAMGAAPRDATAARGKLESWDWVESTTTMLATPPSAPARLELTATVSLFRGTGGASSAFRDTAGVAPEIGAQVAGPGVGDEVRWYALRAGDPAVSTVVFRRRNVIFRISVSDGSALATGGLLTLARIEDEKSLDRRSLVSPTPFAGPTPASQPAWVDRGGNRPAASELQELDGPSRCGWQDSAFILWHGQQYVRDLGGRFAGQTATEFLRNASLPADARATGYHSGVRELWVTADANPDSVYVKVGTSAERWPRLDRQCK